jgi:DNA-binding NarL/FixJ family response regulator
MRSTRSPPPLRVLIAEAHPIVALGLTDLLQKLGYELVGSVRSGRDAVIAASEQCPDLMLMAVDLIRAPGDGLGLRIPGLLSNG